MKSNPIIEYTFDEPTRMFWSTKEAAAQLGITVPHLMRLIHAGERYRGHTYLPYYHITVAATHYPIVQLRDGIIINQFRSVVEAAAALNYPRNYISNHIKYGTPDCWGCLWQKLPHDSQNL